MTGDFVFLSGQIGIDPVTGILNWSSVEGQTPQVLKNLKEDLNAFGLIFKDIIQTRIYLTNMSNRAAINRIYAASFNNTYPARAAVKVAGLPKGAKVKIGG